MTPLQRSGAALGPALRPCPDSFQRRRMRRRAGLPVQETEPTARQIEVLALIGQGLTAAEVGKRLFITEHTAKTHLRNLYETIGAKSAPHAVTLGYEQGWLPLAAGLTDTRQEGLINVEE